MPSCQMNMLVCPELWIWGNVEHILLVTEIIDLQIFYAQ